MATIIQIKRTTTANLPSTLEQGELAYLYDTSATDTDAGGNGGRLFIGDPTTNTNTPLVIGGKYYTDLMDHAQGTLTASAAVLVDANKKVDEWNVDNIKINGNAITSTDTNGDISVTPDGTGKSIVSNMYVDATTSLQEYIEDISGGTYVEGEGIDITYDDGAGTTTISAEDATDTNKGIASFDSNDFVVTGGAVTVKAGSIENGDLAGSITNNKLVNSTITMSGDSGSNAVDLGDTFAINGDTGITTTVAGDTVSIDLDDTAVTTGSYGSSTEIPVITVDQQGRLTAASTASVATTLTIGGDSGSGSVDLLNDTFSVVGGEGIDVSVSGTDITVSGEDASDTNKGIATFASADFTVTSGNVVIAAGGVSNAQLAGSIANSKLVNDSITIGSDATALGGSITDLNGLTSVDVDNLTLDGNTISSTDTDGDVNLTPNGQGTVIVPTGYESRTGFQDQSLVNKAYVDQVANGLDVKASVKVATTENLSATYNNSNGTLTATANGAISIDGVTLSVDDRVLVKDQTDAKQNGFYKVTTTGGASAAFVLTRTPDANEASEITGGAFTFVEEGTNNADNGYVATHNGTPTLGTDNITFDQFSGAGQISAGAALTKTGNTLDVQVDDSSIEVSGDSLQVKALGVTNAMLAGSIANTKLTNSTITMAGDSGSQAIDLGDTFTITGGSGITSAVSGDSISLGVNVDNSSIEISGDSLQVKALGITNAMLAGSIVNAKLVNDSVTINGSSVALGASITLDTGDFAENGNLFYTDERVDDRINNLFVAGEGIDFTYDDVNNTFTVDAEIATASNRGVATFNTANFAVTSGDVTIIEVDGGTY